MADEQAHRLFTQAGLDAGYAGMLVGLLQNVKAGHAALVTPDVAQVTGQTPRTLRQFADDTADIMRTS